MSNPPLAHAPRLTLSMIVQNEAKGISFQPIKNISFGGEDRHFCIRACALGIDLFVDTHYPAYHIFRDSEWDGGLQFLNGHVFFLVRSNNQHKKTLPRN